MVINFKKQYKAFRREHFTSDLTQRISADCVICTREEPNQTGLEILHITEGMSFHPKEETARVHLDIISRNSGDLPLRYRVIHPGKTKASLQKFAFEGTEDPRIGILASLYADRIKSDDKTPETIQFYKRVNCLGIDSDCTKVSPAGPKGCFEEGVNKIQLSPEIEDAQQEDTPFTSYIIPPLEKLAILPGETDICTIKLEMSNTSYRRLVGDGNRISVDSYARLMRAIEAYDLSTKPNDPLRNLYRTHVKAEGAIIEPNEYDIVVFQELGQAMELESGNIRITPVPFTNVEPSSKVLWFFGQSGGEFCLNLAYPSV